MGCCGRPVVVVVGAQNKLWWLLCNLLWTCCECRPETTLRIWACYHATLNQSGSCSVGYHLAECHYVPLGQVPFRKIVNLTDFADFYLTRCHAVTCSSAAIHLAECTNWSFIQVTSRTVMGTQTKEPDPHPYFQLSEKIEQFIENVLFSGC